MDIKYAILGYNTLNIGDDIQSLIMTFILPRIDYIIERDNYDNIYDYVTGKKINKLGNKVLLIMNGWFMQGPNYTTNNIKFPIKNGYIIPLYISTHLSPNVNELLNSECINDYIKNEPFYTRDQYTFKILKNKNVDCYYFGCVTQLFEKKYLGNYHMNNYTILADCPIDFTEKYTKENPNEQIQIISHTIPLDKVNENPKNRMENAKKLLIFYCGANKIITTRLHCYLPCRALNINVTYIGSIDTRTIDLVTTIPNTEFLISTLKLAIDNKLKKLKIE